MLRRLRYSVIAPAAAATTLRTLSTPVFGGRGPKILHRSKQQAQNDASVCSSPLISTTLSSEFATWICEMCDAVNPNVVFRCSLCSELRHDVPLPPHVAQSLPENKYISNNNDNNSSGSCDEVINTDKRGAVKGKPGIRAGEQFRSILKCKSALEPKRQFSLHSSDPTLSWLCPACLVFNSGSLLSRFTHPCTSCGAPGPEMPYNWLCGMCFQRCKSSPHQPCPHCDGKYSPVVKCLSCLRVSSAFAKECTACKVDLEKAAERYFARRREAYRSEKQKQEIMSRGVVGGGGGRREQQHLQRRRDDSALAFQRELRHKKEMRVGLEVERRTAIAGRREPSAVSVAAATKIDAAALERAQRERRRGAVQREAIRKDIWEQVGEQHQQRKHQPPPQLHDEQSKLPHTLDNLIPSKPVQPQQAPPPQPQQQQQQQQQQDFDAGRIDSWICQECGDCNATSMSACPSCGAMREIVETPSAGRRQKQKQQQDDAVDDDDRLSPRDHHDKIAAAAATQQQFRDRTMRITSETPTWTCSSCSNIVPTSQLVCPLCLQAQIRRPLDETQQQQLQQQQLPGSAPVLSDGCNSSVSWHCPICRTENPANNKMCRMCLINTHADTPPIRSFVQKQLQLAPDGDTQLAEVALRIAKNGGGGGGKDGEGAAVEDNNNWTCPVCLESENPAESPTCIRCEEPRRFPSDDENGDDNNERQTKQPSNSNKKAASAAVLRSDGKECAPTWLCTACLKWNKTDPELTLQPRGASLVDATTASSSAPTECKFCGFEAGENRRTIWLCSSASCNKVNAPSSSSTSAKLIMRDEQQQQAATATTTIGSSKIANNFFSLVAKESAHSNNDDEENKSSDAATSTSSSRIVRSATWNWGYVVHCAHCASARVVEKSPSVPFGWFCSECGGIDGEPGKRCPSCGSPPAYPADWRCSSCNGVNYSRRLGCRRCGKLRSTEPSAAALAAQQWHSRVAESKGVVLPTLVFADVEAYPYVVQYRPESSKNMTAAVVDATTATAAPTATEVADDDEADVFDDNLDDNEVPVVRTSDNPRVADDVDVRGDDDDYDEHEIRQVIDKVRQQNPLINGDDIVDDDVDAFIPEDVVHHSPRRERGSQSANSEQEVKQPAETATTKTAAPAVASWACSLCDEPSNPGDAVECTRCGLPRETTDLNNST